MSRTVRGRTVKGACTGLLAGSLLAFVLALSPHLVHHLSDWKSPASHCPFAWAADHTPCLVVEPTPVLPDWPEFPARVDLTPTAQSRAASGHSSRGPPPGIA